MELKRCAKPLAKSLAPTLYQGAASSRKEMAETRGQAASWQTAVLADEAERPGTALGCADLIAEFPRIQPHGSNPKT
jgi:hypothetical protein